MFSKEELLEKDIPELENIAKDLEAEYNKTDDKESIIYAILDRQAMNAGASHPLGTAKRKRTRIAKKDPDKVYTVHGKEGENFDLQKNKPQGVPQPSLFKDMPDEQPAVKEEAAPVTEEEAPKKRGRKKKEETEKAVATAATEVPEAETPKRKRTTQKATEEPQQTETAAEVQPEAPIETRIAAPVEAETPAEANAEAIIPEAEFTPDTENTTDGEAPTTSLSSSKQR